MKTILTFFQSRVSQGIEAILLVVALYAGGSSTALSVSVDDFAARWFTNAQGVLPYRLFIPTNYTPADHFPLVLFLHGAGERGNDNWYQLVGQTGSLVFASETNQVEHPSFMVAPQCPLDSYWDDSRIRGLVLGMINALQSEFSLDTNRLYITGLSMGGYGTWDYIGRYPGMYAAAVPMSGGGSTSLAPRMKPIAIWNFHAADDGTVSVSLSRSMVSSVRRNGGNPIYTEYASGGHVIWTPAYDTPVLMDWVYAQRLGVNPTNEPLLTITSPTAEPISRTGSTNLNLSGTAAALGQAITGMSWTNFANNVKGLATGTDLWSVTNIPLVASKTNVVAVVATTTSWTPEYGGVTTFNDTLTVIQSPIQATLALQGAEALLNWTGGGPPYRVQEAADLNAGDWTDFLPNATPPVTLPLDGQAGFYRIVGQ
jgi:poly(3-hydroxybutyrate) depolymerase